MPKNGTTTKEKILSESKRLVLAKGFAGMSIDQILEKTSITKGAFFYHFKSKADLALALMVRFAEDDKKEMEQALKETERYADNPKERLLQFVQYFIDMMAELDGPHPGCLYISYIHEPDSFDITTKTIIADAIVMWRETLLKLIDAVMAKHTPVIDINKETLADYFNVVFEGALVLDKALQKRGFTAEQLVHLKNYYNLLFQ